MQTKVCPFFILSTLFFICFKIAFLYEKEGDCGYLIDELRNRYLGGNEFTEALVVQTRPGYNSTIADGLARTKSLTRSK